METTLKDLSKKELIEKILLLEKEKKEPNLISLENSESEFYFNILESINDLVFVHPFSEDKSHSRNFIYANSSALKKLNYSLKEIKAIDPTDITVGAKSNNLNSEHEKIINEGSSTFNKTLITKRNTEIEIELISNIVELNNIKVVVTIGRDNSQLTRTKKSLHHSEQSIKAILNASKDLIILVDPLGEILETNDFMLLLFNVRKFDVIGRNLSWYIGDEGNQKRLDYLQKVVTTQKPVYYEDKFLGRIWETSLYPVFNENNDVVSIACYLKDKTHAIQIEKQLKDGNKRFEMVLNVAKLGWWDYNYTNNTSSKSEMWFKMLGYKKKDIPSPQELFKNIIHPDDSNLIHKIWKEHEEGMTEYFSYEHRLLHSDGEYRWIYNWGQIIEREKNGNPIRSVGIHMDVTDKKKAEEKEQILLKSYYGVINNAIDAIYILDKEGTFVDVNDAALKMYGYTREFFIGKTPEFLAAPDKNNMSDVMEKINRAFNGENIEFDFWGLRKNREEFPKIVRLSKVNYLGKESLAAFGLDISDRYNAEQKLKSSKERYKTIFNQVPLSITQIDNMGNIVDINYHHIKHISKDKLEINDFIGSNVLERESLKKAGVIHHYKDLLLGKPFDLEEVKFPITTGGCEAFFNLHGVPLLSEGKQIGALITIEDVTDQVKNKNILKEVEIRLGLALDGASIAFWDHDLLNDKVFRSDQWFEMLGYKKGEFSNNLSVLTDLIHPDDLEEYENKLKAHKKQKTNEFNSEIRLRNANDEYQWILNWGRVIERSDDGTPLRGAGIHMDITDRKITEEKLKTSEEYYRALFESQPNIIWDEDFSEVKKRLDELKNKGVDDFEIYFNKNPKAVEELSGLVKINDFNSETLEVLEADSKDELIKNLPFYFNTEDSWRVFKDELVALANNQLTFESEVTINSLKGNPKHLYLKLLIPSESKETFDRVLVSFTDITDLRESSVKLQEAQRKYLSLVEQAKEGILINQDWELKFTNKYLAKMLGYTFNEILNAPIHKFIAPDYVEKTKEIFIGRLTGKNVPHVYESMAIRKDGSTIPIEINASFMMYNGKPAVQSIVRNITKQKKVEQKNKLLNNMLQASPIGYIVTDTNGIITDLNPALENITGYTRNELLGKNPEILNAEVNAEEIQKTIFQSLQNEKTWDGELLNRKKSGELHYINSSIFPLFEGDKIIAYVGFQTDITERKNAEIALAKTSNQLELAIKGGDIGVFSWDIKKNEINIDQRIKKSLGYTTQNGNITTPEIIKRFTHPGDFENLILKLNDHFNKNVPTHEAEMRAKHKNGEWVWYLIRGKVVEWDASGNPLIMTGTHLNINERKRNEEDLKRTKEQLEYAIYGSQVGIWDWDINTNLIGISYYWASMLGFELSDLNPMTLSKWQEFLHPEDKSKTSNQLDEYLSGKIAFYQSEFRLKHKSEKWVWVLARGRIAEWNEDGSPKRMVGTHLDITIRKDAELALKNNEARFRALYENAPLSYQSLNNEGNFVDVNPSWLKTLGYKREEVIGQWYGDFLHPTWRSKFEQNFDKFKKRGYVTGVHFRIRHKLGNFLDIQFEGCIGYDPDGSVRQTYCVFQDITDQKKTVLALRNSEIKYKTLYDNALIALFRVSPEEQKVLEANKVAAELFGYSSVPEFINEFKPEERFADKKTKEDLDEELYSNGSINKIMMHSKKKDGTTIWNESSFLLDKETGYVDCFSIDNTDRVRAEIKLKESNEKLRNLYRYLNKVREEERKLIAREVHDNLGQKLTALNLDISWIKQNIPENLSKISKDLEPVLELINDSIITVQKISTSLRPGILDDLGLVNAIQWQSNEYSRRTKLKFELNLREDDIDINDDIKTSLFRVYQETLTNIVRHAEATTVKVNLSFKKTKILFEIVDNGVGIPKNKLDDLSSFGLIGMRERIASINGSIEFINRIQKGTKIKITVPLMEEE